MGLAPRLACQTPCMIRFLLLFVGLVASAEPSLPAVFTDHMVLQREMAVPVWGKAPAGEEVVVEFAGQKKTAVADASGRWKLKLDPMAASAEPRVLKVGSLSISDVLVGEVWLCSGQSNMGMSVGESADAEKEVAAANHPKVRLFTVASNPVLRPVADVRGAWSVCSAQTVRSFSAAAYYFGRKLHEELKVPVGLIHSSVGGTPVESWTRMEVLRRNPAVAARVDAEVAEMLAQPETTRLFPAARRAWEEKYGVRPPATAESAKGWAEDSADTKDWKTVRFPAQWGQQGFKSGGVFWIRKEVDLPASAAGKSFSLSLVWISEQYDTVYWNGEEIGHAADQPPEFYNQQRRYQVPARLVKPGRNVIAVRIVSATEKAGPWVAGHQLGLPVEDVGKVGDEWLLRQESAFALLPPAALAERPKPSRMVMRNVPASLYTGMIAPLAPYGLRGVLWYQGESNAPRHKEYRELLSAMIKDWRAQWGQGDFPFISQQLVNNGLPYDDADRPRDSWPYLREAQVRVADEVPNVSLAVGIELGSKYTIHPQNKQEVGRRLALVALEKTYGQALESSGPRYLGMKVEGPTIRVTFRHAAGLRSKDGEPRRFAVAGADRKFFWANARIEGGSVVVSSREVLSPVSVRYAWAENPEGCNLYNAAELPASPFRTDTW
jgi:sialate O-acetylesterase